MENLADTSEPLHNKQMENWINSFAHLVEMRFRSMRPVFPTGGATPRQDKKGQRGK